MPLRDLRTNLKTLKYGNDRPGGGSSGQPYYTVDVNFADNSISKLSNFDDGLVRGGVIGATRASSVDTFRIGRFLTDLPKGPLFIAKQVGLQLSNPQLEHKKLKTDNPTKGQGLFKNIGNFITNTANKLTNAVGPTRLYNLGINTLAQVNANALGQHIDRHGLLPERDNDNLYFRVVLNNNDETNNRLVGLTSILGNPNKDIIPEYTGGPNSVYGIGYTLIRRRGDFIDINRDTTATKWATSDAFASSEFKAGLALVNDERQAFTFIDSSTFNGAVSSGLGQRNKLSAWNRSKHIGGTAYSKGEYDRFGAFFDTPTDPNEISKGIDQIASVYDIDNATTGSKGQLKVADADNNARAGKFSRLSTKASSFFAPYRFDRNGDTNIKDTPTGLNEITKFQTYTGSATWIPQNGDPRKSNPNADLGISKIGSSDIPNTIATDQNVISYLPGSDSTKKYNQLRSQINKKSTITQNYFQTIPVNVSRNDPDFKYVKAELAEKFNRPTDIINNDTLALQFTPLDPFTGNNLNILRFLGYITDFSENYDSTWSDVNYAGRAESFYIFNKFKRTASVGFNIACYNAKELEEKHCALSELASTLAGKYKDNLLMGGIITRLKLGRYINNQPGIITNLTFSPIQDSSWDLDRQLAFYLKVSFGFTLIHDFLPQYYKCGFIDREPEVILPPKKEEPPKPPSPPDPGPNPPRKPSEVRADEAIYGERYRMEQYTKDIDQRFKNYNNIGN